MNDEDARRILLAIAETKKAPAQRTEDPFSSMWSAVAPRTQGIVIGAIAACVAMGLWWLAFTPQTYNDCILRNMHSGLPVIAVIGITDACEAKFPESVPK